MYKKIVSMVVIAMILWIPALPVHAAGYMDGAQAEQESSAGITPFFVGVDIIMASFSISPSGVARGMVNVIPKNASSLDYILTTASVVNASGTAVKTWTNIKSTINVDDYFIFDQSYTLQKRDKYKFVYTVKCYKNGTMIDTASGETIYKTY
ncbi:MAG: hypothetical protein PHG06_13315 [Parabacteroides sp.]|nr:hypothetical protein [Parabacteroides sp.]